MAWELSAYVQQGPIQGYSFAPLVSGGQSCLAKATARGAGELLPAGIDGGTGLDAIKACNFSIYLSSRDLPCTLLICTL